MKVTVEEIARHAGVSKATVSRVLNGAQDGVGAETRKRVRQVVEELNYDMSALRSTRNTAYSQIIALIVPDIANPFFAELIQTVENCANMHGYNILLGNTSYSQERESNYIADFVSKKVDGIILIPSHTTGTKNHKLPEKYNVPCVLLDGKIEDMCYTAGVFADNEYAMFSSCELLIKNGSRKIAFISGSRGRSTSLERLAGYKTALAQYGIPFDPSLVAHGNYTLESGYNAIIDFERMGIRYNAVLAANDMMAIGAMKALKEFSCKIPEEVEIIGFDNISFALHSDPPLTTTQQPTIEMGRRATEMLIEVLNGAEPTDRNIRLLPKLLVRKTTK